MSSEFVKIGKISLASLDEDSSNRRSYSCLKEFLSFGVSLRWSLLLLLLLLSLLSLLLLLSLARLLVTARPPSKEEAGE